MNSRSTVLTRWLPLALAALLLVLCVAAAVDGSVGQAVLYGLATAAFAAQFALSYRTPPPRPAHVDDDWARGVLAGAGHPTGVAAVKALRDAAPGLSLVDATQLADRVTP